MTPDDLIVFQVVFLVLTETIFIWTNYKNRFRYGTMEQSPLWRFTDRKMGMFSLLLHPLALIGMFIIISGIVYSYNTGIGPAISITLALLIGFVGGDASHDWKSVNYFEKTCLKCKHTKECKDFHEELCISEPIRKRTKAADNWISEHEGKVDDT